METECSLRSQSLNRLVFKYGWVWQLREHWGMNKTMNKTMLDRVFYCTDDWTEYPLLHKNASSGNFMCINLRKMSVWILTSHFSLLKHICIVLLLLFFCVKHPGNVHNEVILEGKRLQKSSRSCFPLVTSYFLWPDRNSPITFEIVRAATSLETRDLWKRSILLACPFPTVIDNDILIRWLILKQDMKS